MNPFWKQNGKLILISGLVTILIVAGLCWAILVSLKQRNQVSEDYRKLVSQGQVLAGEIIQYVPFRAVGASETDLGKGVEGISVEVRYLVKGQSKTFYETW